jgi:hypothetical protein
LTDASAVPDSIDRTLVRLLAAGQLALVAVTWPLWTDQADFPQIPLIAIAGRVPDFVTWMLTGIGLIAVSSMLFLSRAMALRLSCLSLGMSTFVLVCIDQHRLQPWAWQFLILSVVLAAADGSTARSCWRWLIISIYAWSAWSKLDVGFFTAHGPFLMDGLCKSIGLSHGTQAWPAALRLGVAVAVPTFELGVAAGLAFRRTRKLALIGATILHGLLLLALGPLGHGHRPGVLVWNLFFLVQNGLLFWRRSSHTESDAPPIRVIRIGNLLARIAVMSAIVWPAFESLGLCDHWPAWAVYAAKPERITVFIHTEELPKVIGVNESFEKYVQSQTTIDEWHPVRIDRWSLDAVYAPIYPQDRFQVGVALSLAQRFDLHLLRLSIEGPANRITGKRFVKEYIGLDSVNHLAKTYRCNALPRSVEK